MFFFIYGTRPITIHPSVGNKQRRIQDLPEGVDHDERTEREPKREFGEPPAGSRGRTHGGGIFISGQQLRIKMKTHPRGRGRLRRASTIPALSKFCSMEGGLSAHSWIRAGNKRK